MNKTLKSLWIETPIGPILAAADGEVLFHLEFDSQLDIPEGRNPILTSIEKELKAYFAKKLTRFATPLKLHGTSFQERVWQELCEIPYGETRSYTAIADRIGHPRAYRAVGNANGCNTLAIIVPCHRVIAADGSLGGYASGLSRKQFLLNLEGRGR